METKGKGALPLLLVSGLFLFHIVASHPTCLEAAGCQAILQDLYYFAAYESSSMYLHASEQFQIFEKEYSPEPDYFLPAIQKCHATDMLAPYERKLLGWTEKDLLNIVIRLLHSWNEPLKHMAQEAHRLQKLNAFLSVKYKSISLKYEQLKELMVQIASTVEIEVPSKVEFTSWSEMESLSSSDEQTHLFTVYNLYRCFANDANRIKFMISFLKWKADKKGPDSPIFTPLSEMSSNDPSFKLLF